MTRARAKQIALAHCKPKFSFSYIHIDHVINAMENRQRLERMSDAHDVLESAWYQPAGLPRVAMRRDVRVIEVDLADIERRLCAALGVPPEMMEPSKRMNKIPRT
jgi:hypothetical protein